jgi:pSer/pThr/pTyr-binding forkhead associated (FHA) protein
LAAVLADNARARLMNLIIKAPGAPAQAVELRAGVNRLGRSANNDIPIGHPSVSATHCQILFKDERAIVSDLNSTNGTFLDGARIQQSQWEPGQKLRLGEVEVLIANDVLTRAVEPTAPPRLTLADAGRAAGAGADAASAAVEAPVAAPRPPSLLGPGATRKRPVFFQTIPAAFGYPLKENGLNLLAGGTLFLAALELVGSVGFGIIAVGLGIASTGYLFLFMQAIITTSATGEDQPPSWPDWENWWETGVGPYLTMLGICVFCLGPGYLCLKFAPAGPAIFSIGSAQAGGYKALAIPLFIAGALYLPMALLAVSMYDSLAALNPLLVVRSIFRVPGQYALNCLVLAVLCGAAMALVAAIGRFVSLPFVPALAVKFLSLYSLMVAMRLLGLLYFTLGDRLGWPFK